MNEFDIFDELKNKDIFCFGSGKHFKNITCPFLRESRLLSNLKGFIDTNGDVVIDGHAYRSIRKSDLAKTDFDNTVVLIAVTGYREILSQFGSDPVLSKIKAIPSIYPEALYEDRLLLSAKKPPLGFRKNHTHLAIVRNASKVVGIITMEDILEELVGDMSEKSPKLKGGKK